MKLLLKFKLTLKTYSLFYFLKFRKTVKKKSEKRFTFEKHKKPIKFQLKREYTEKNILKCEPTKRYQDLLPHQAVFNPLSKKE